ncbi:MAG: hypothetical protein VBE63_08440 [Lamprobacter sp.]|uniref:hypothetical protein n=1 Tax=Lamprobacter sp. TaxID=3100796 RepID=UPI002B259BC5|nr:hypothetical protein [Lamprobacter sp.]MEA3639958.1 hypothetical protein [Lamprobacter sp.]
MQRILDDPETRAIHAARCVAMAKERNTRMIEYRGETKSITEWEKHLGLPKDIISKRLNDCNWSVEQALSTPAPPKNIEYTFEGRTQTRAEWAKELGITTAGLSDRVRRLGVEAALSMPYTDRHNAESMREKAKRNGRPTFKHEGKECTITELAEELGTNTRTLWAFLQSHTYEEAVEHYNALKQRNGKTLKEIAESVGVPPGTFAPYARRHGVEAAIAHYEKRKTQGPSMTEIAKSLGVKPFTFMAYARRNGRDAAVKHFSKKATAA